MRTVAVPTQKEQFSAVKLDDPYWKCRMQDLRRDTQRTGHVGVTIKPYKGRPLCICVVIPSPHRTALEAPQAGSGLDDSMVPDTSVCWCACDAS